MLRVLHLSLQSDRPDHSQRENQDRRTITIEKSECYQYFKLLCCVIVVIKGVDQIWVSDELSGVHCCQRRGGGL